jgi:hypothetical protein
VLILCASVVMLVISAGARADAATSGIQGASIVIGEAPVSVVVSNDGPAAEVSIQVSALAEADGKLSPATLSTDWINGNMPPAATRRLTLTVTGWDHKTALTGSIAVLTTSAAEPAKPAVARTPVEVRPGATITPGATSWSVDSYKRSVGLDEGPYGTVLPLADGASCPAGGATLDVLLTSGHKTAKATLTCADKTNAIRITFAGFDGAGTYTAKVPMGAAIVDLSVRRSIAWPEPLFWLVLGLVIALWRAYWVSTGRTSAVRIAAYDQLRNDANAAHNAFKTAATGKPYASYDIRPGIQSWIDDHKAAAADPKAEATAIAAAEKVLARWTAAPADIDKPVPGDPLTSQVFVAYAARLATIKSGQAGTLQAGRQELDYDALTEVLDDVANAGAVSKMAVRLDSLRSRLPADNETNGWTAAAKHLRDELELKITGLLNRAAAVEHATDAKALTDEVKSAEGILDQLPPKAPLKLEGIVEDERAVVAGGGPPGPVDEPEWKFDDQLVQSKYRALQLFLNEWFVLITSSLIAIGTAFALLYVGKPWGTWPDRVAMLAWGLAATTFTAELLASLGALARKRPLSS